MKKYIRIFLLLELLIFLFGNEIIVFAEKDLIINPINIPVNIPDELRESELSEHLILEDINQDGLLDIIFLMRNKIYLSYQEKNGGFSEFDGISVPMGGAIDFGDIVPAGEKEILIVHKDGLSYFMKELKGWIPDPVLLIKNQTIFNQYDTGDLKREYFAIDLDEDGIQELILWGNEVIHFYYRDKSNGYILVQSVPYESRTHLVYPGLKIYHSPLGWLRRVDSKNIYRNSWPVDIKYLSFSTAKISNRYLIRDSNHDSKKDLIQIRSVEKRDTKKGYYFFYEYRVYFLNEDKRFSESPDKIIHDPHGAWLSPNCIDINNDGHLDLLKVELEGEGGLFKAQKYKIWVYLSKYDDNYLNKPSQVIETTDYPIGREMLVDIDGDKKKDLILIHPKTGGYSIGSIVNKFLEKGVDAEIRILPFKTNVGFSKKEIIKKRVKIKFMASIPINLSGDFNKDGKKDLLIIEKNRIKIYPFLGSKKGFSARPKINLRIDDIGNYMVKDLNQDETSDLIIFSADKMRILFF